MVLHALFPPALGLQGIEEETLNRRRQMLRRVGGFILLLLGVALFAGFHSGRLGNFGGGVCPGLDERLRFAAGGIAAGDGGPASDLETAPPAQRPPWT